MTSEREREVTDRHNIPNNIPNNNIPIKGSLPSTKTTPAFRFRRSSDEMSLQALNLCRNSVHGI